MDKALPCGMPFMMPRRIPCFTHIWTAVSTASCMERPLVCCLRISSIQLHFLADTVELKIKDMAMYLMFRPFSFYNKRK